MKKIFFVMALALAMASCASQKRALYFQDLGQVLPDVSEQYQIRLRPLDRLTVIVNSQRPELAAPFNTSSSYNSLTGTPIDGKAMASTSTGNIQVRTIDAEGYLEMPIIGKIYCQGKTRSELAEEIADLIIKGGHLNDPSVNIEFADMAVTVLGEVARPGRYDIHSDRISLLDALSMAGDLTVFGQRHDVTVIREEDGKRTYGVVDLRSQDVFLSPYFYLQQNDVIYVKPNKYKAQTGEYNQNRSFYISLVSAAVSVATLLVTITR